ncbi:MAG: coenzyme F420-0:L-glutamate ligase [Candidatus Falkowbacteria bacterium]
MKIKAIKTRIFKPNENLLIFIEKYLPSISERSILVVTSKIVALAEGRLVKYINEASKEKIIKGECEFSLQTKHVLLTIKNGVVMANAGVDENNADGNIILLPADSFKAADKIRKYFCSKYKLKEMGVIITDSRCLPLRAGITGVALGYAGFEGLKSYKNTLDIFGRPFKYSQVDVADSLATAAVLCMGEGDERMPLALIKEAPIKYCEKINKKELKIDIEEDMYWPLFRRIK